MIGQENVLEPAPATVEEGQPIRGRNSVPWVGAVTTQACDTLPALKKSVSLTVIVRLVAGCTSCGDTGAVANVICAAAGRQWHASSHASAMPAILRRLDLARKPAKPKPAKPVLLPI